MSDKVTPIHRDGKQQSAVALTPGTGITLAGIWIGASSLTIAILLIAFVYTPVASEWVRPFLRELSDGWLILALIAIFLVLASPMILTYTVTKMILNKD